jgi:hypothetical protein
MISRKTSFFTYCLYAKNLPYRITDLSRFFIKKITSFAQPQEPCYKRYHLGIR